MPISQITTNSIASNTITSGILATSQTLSVNGITFPVTQSASADANTLDDYEEGTWTPTWLNIGNGTYSQQFGRYTKIGRLVTIECYLVINAIGSASGNATIVGLPFACGNTVSTAQMWTNNWTSSAQNVCGLISNQNQIDLFLINASSGVAQIAMANLTNNSNIVFNFTYSV